MTQTVDSYPDPPQMAANPDHPQEPSPFRELPSNQEMPEIRVIDQRDADDREPLVEVFQNQSGRYQLRVAGPVTSLSLPAGDYRFALYGRYFRRHGEPDQFGTLTCRRFRLYQIDLITDYSGRRQEVHLGDE